MGRFSEAARESMLRRQNATRTEDHDLERYERGPSLTYLADDEPWDVGAYHEFEYGPGARSW